MTTKTLASNLWESCFAHEVEFERLRAHINLEKIRNFLSLAFSAETKIDKSKTLTHLFSVATLARRHAETFFVDLHRADRSYQCDVVEATGLLHESMTAGFTFEDLIQHADEAVAKHVSDITPDIREPEVKRSVLYVNRVGHAEEVAQTVKLADIQHELVLWQKYAKQPNNCYFLIKNWCYEAREVLASLHKIEVKASTLIKSLRNQIQVLDQSVRVP